MHSYTSSKTDAIAARVGPSGEETTMTCHNLLYVRAFSGSLAGAVAPSRGAYTLVDEVVVPSTWRPIEDLTK